MNRRQHLTICAILIAGLLVLSASGAFPWSKLNCRNQEIDISSGRIRNTRHLFFCQIAATTEDSWLTRAMGGTNDTPDWRTVNTFSPGFTHSPHYQFHSAIHSIRVLEGTHDFIPIEADAQSLIAASLVHFWKTEKVHDAESFVDSIARTALTLHDKGSKTVAASDIPSS
jgi:hypothetical protein